MAAENGDSALPEAHYREVAELLAAGLVTPFLGAGVNLAVPGRPKPKPWERGKLLPSGGELAADIARDFRYPVADGEGPDLLRVAQFASLGKLGQGKLYHWLREVFDDDYPPTPVHTFFARLPNLLAEKGYPRRNLLIVTTNYDDALERALRDADELCDVVWYVADGPSQGQFRLWENWPDGPPPTEAIEDPSECTELSTKRRTVVLKIHGAIDRTDSERDSYVITEDHYIDYLTRIELGRVPVMLAKTLRTTAFLFLGYSLSDWNMRALLHKIWEQQNARWGAWSIQFDASDLEKKVWAARGVDIQNIALDTYVAKLQEAVMALPAATSNPPAAFTP